MKAITLGALGLLCAGLASAPASAAPLGLGVLNAQSQQQGAVEQVAWRRWRHGGWHHGHHHHSNNWGWWGVPFGLGLGLALTAPYYNDYGYGYSDYGYGYRSGYGNAHVDYCLRRYRSYDPATNTFLGYDGYRHECLGPY